MIRNVRVAYPHMFTPEANKYTGKLEYSVRVILEKGDPQIEKIKAYMTKIYQDKFPGKTAAGKPQYLAKMNAAAENKNTRFLQYDAENEFYYFNTKRRAGTSEPAPMVLDKDRRKLDAAVPDDTAKIYGGCYCNVLINGYVYEKASTGFSSSLLGLQFVKDGEPFASYKQATTDDFDDLSNTGDSAANDADQFM